MRLHMHNYHAANIDGIIDGAILMHREMTQRLLEQVEILWHNIYQGESCLEGIQEGDIVYSGIGPYAYLYHYWRERIGVDFRIIREVHTTFWSGYWTQEEVCQPLIRPGDYALFPTEYTRQVYMQYFDSIMVDNSATLYPILDRFPRKAPRKIQLGYLRIGYLGALSLAKNFDQVLNIFVGCYHKSKAKVSLTIAGKSNHHQWSQVEVRKRLESKGVASQHIRMLEVITPQELDSFFSKIDVLLFPSTASRESLGRVVLEALAHGVPVIAADVGPTVELLPLANKLQTDLRTDQTFSMDKIVALGQVDEQSTIEKLLSRAYEESSILNEISYTTKQFWQMLNEPRYQPPKISGWDRKILDSLIVEKRNLKCDETLIKEAEALFFNYFQGNNDWLIKLIKERISPNEESYFKLLEIVENQERNLADYRAYPRLVDALLLPPLSFSLHS